MQFTPLVVAIHTLMLVCVCWIGLGARTETAPKTVGGPFGKKEPTQTSKGPTTLFFTIACGAVKNDGIECVY